MTAIPLFMGVHERLPEGATAEDVAEAHRAAVDVQQLHGVRYLRCWTDAEAGKLFCLLEAPSAEAAAAVHLEAYGLLVERFYEVQEDR